MRKTKIIKKQVVETCDIICNMCAKSCRGEFNFNGLVEVSVTGEYDSEILEDLVKYTFSICENCLSEKVFGKCKIPPQTEQLYYNSVI